MTARRTISYGSRAAVAAVLATLVIAPVGSQQELPSHQADLRFGQGAAPDPAKHTQKLANIPAAGSIPDGRGNPLWGRPLNSFTATRERPLFAPTRRPPPMPTASPTPVQQLPASTRPPLALVGAIAGEKEGIAIFLDENTKSMVRLKTGESHQGWTLRSVQGREATLQSERHTAVLGLGAR